MRSEPLIGQNRPRSENLLLAVISEKEASIVRPTDDVLCKFVRFA